MSELIYQTPSGAAVVIDIPATLSFEEGVRPVSCEPLREPYALPEPKNGAELRQTRELETVHERLAPFLKKGLEELRGVVGEGEWCLERTVRDLSKEDKGLVQWQDMMESMRGFGAYDDQTLVDLTEQAEDTIYDLSDIYGRMVTNSSPHTRLLRIRQPSSEVHDYHMPRGCSFFISPFETSIEHFSNTTATLAGYDLIIMDPPWPNRSVKRGTKNYAQIDIASLLDIPAGRWLRDEDSVVGVWVTNKVKYRNFVEEELFDRWGMRKVGEVVWVKVTEGGEPMFDMDSRMRKPYECLILGRLERARTSRQKRMKMDRANEGSRRDDDAGGAIGIKVIAAVPDAHSRKPNVSTVLSQHLPITPTACELFARNLLPNYVSFANEPLKFMRTDEWGTCRKRLAREGAAGTRREAFFLALQ
ncbi:MT-A70-domain-containing protein [Saitoella complicata NRRL Y-17804]|uniref:MT-A70-domain-containing protein n=1 Tax=Saitoella complicata (strain BCRC 22490 / CBS 7301 / JCM 7358 / NBRC 10748 / NRRL Y-17804) TaxID=698492 RepID=UPI0008682B11|nr:MT-A70-domain-containing protein [Saitoella complicata NRRL Y-17804]ODQ56142.1 MT-A70-domain-containing protein [Saitoella complicata NRRL Y-17804]